MKHLRARQIYFDDDKTRVKDINREFYSLDMFYRDGYEYITLFKYPNRFYSIVYDTYRDIYFLHRPFVKYTIKYNSKESALDVFCSKLSRDMLFMIEYVRERLDKIEGFYKSSQNAPGFTK